MRRKKEFKPDGHGRFSREIGWKRSPDEGRFVQHKFYLGNDRDKAELANVRLEQLWRLIEADHGIDAVNGEAKIERPLWNDVTLDIGRAIARGSTRFSVDMDDRFDGGVAASYARRVQYFSERFSSVIKVVAGDEDAFEKGRQEELEFANRMESLARKIRARVDGDHTGGCGPTLHHAFDAYVAWLRKECALPASNGDETKLTPWGYAQIRNVNRLKERHENVPLARLDHTACEDMLRYWRLRPMVKGKDKAVAPKTAQHHIKQLKRFFNWLHRSQDFNWRRPEDFDLIATKVEVPVHERARRNSPRQVATFDVDQLRLLNEYATPLERALLLLGLNCSFNKAEIGTLIVGEVVLHEKHPFAEMLEFQSLETDSFIKRVRHKNGVYGEFLLWPQTVEAIEWAIDCRKKQAGIAADGAGEAAELDPDSLLFMTEDGRSYIAPTATGNPNQRIPNIFDLLVCRVRRDHGTLPKLSFGKLRKTGANLVKRFSDGEVAATFLCHGQAVEVDDLADIYTDRPFGKVFKALRQVEELLQPMFAAAPAIPFPEERKRGGTNITPGQINKIKKLRQQGFKIAVICQKTGFSRSTVLRHLQG